MDKGNSQKIFKTAVFWDEPGDIYKMDTIEHGMMLWLVPAWLQVQGQTYETPARIICATLLGIQPTGDGEFFLNFPLSKAICDGNYRPPAPPPYKVIEKPDIRFAVRSGKAN